MTTEQVYIPPGTHIEAAAARLVGKANMVGRTVVASFNDVELRAAPGARAQDVVAAFDKACAEARARYAASPEGLAAAQEAVGEVARLQLVADGVAAALDTLDFADQEAILALLGKLQPASDRIGVKVRAGEIAAAFAARGLEPGMCIGDQFNPNDRDVFFRWLVGQALDGLANGPAIHGIFHKFADEWRAKWATP